MFIHFIVQLISWIYSGQITIIVQPQFATIIKSAWYFHLKIKNIYLKICVKKCTTKNSLKIHIMLHILSSTYIFKTLK